MILIIPFISDAENRNEDYTSEVDRPLNVLHATRDVCARGRIGACVDEGDEAHNKGACNTTRHATR